MDQLRWLEKNLIGKEFTYENSSLANLNLDFPLLAGKKFTQWLEAVIQSKSSLSVLEVGGGTTQTAARAILECYPDANYYALEKRPLDLNTKQELAKYPQYHFYNSGLSESSRVPCPVIDIAFAHNVATLLPNPFMLIQYFYQHLSPGGILYINGILVYQHVWQEFVNRFHKTQSFAYHQQTLGSELIKRGLISVNLAMQRTSVHFTISTKIEALIDPSQVLTNTREIFIV
jgi:trans-aconitate methyltransferase